MNQNTMWTWLAVGVLSATISTACAETEPGEADVTTRTGTLCEQAAAHASMCLDESIPVDSSCDEGSASALLAESCDDLRRQSASGKSDGSCNKLFFWKKCNRGIEINLAVCTEEKLCDWSDGRHVANNCFAFQIKDASGQVVVSETTGGWDHLMTRDLPDGDYTVELLDINGQAVELLDGGQINTLTGQDYAAQLTPTFTIEGGKSNKPALDLPILRDSALGVFQCGSVDPTVQLFCGGDVYRQNKGEWDWFMTIEPLSSGALVEHDDYFFKHDHFILSASPYSEAELAGREQETMSADVWKKRAFVSKMTPGSYQVTFHHFAHDRHYSLSNSYDSDGVIKDVLRNSASGYTESFTLELTAEDFASDTYGSADASFEVTYPGGECPQ